MPLKKIRYVEVSGASGSFTTTDLKTVTVLNGVISSIVDTDTSALLLETGDNLLLETGDNLLLE